MFDLPKTSEIRKPLHKKLIYEKYATELSGNKRERFDADISRMIIINEISEASVNVKATEATSAIFVLQVELKRKEYDDKNIIMISKLFGQKLLIVLHYENKYQLAIFETRLLKSDWKNEEDISLKLSGLNLGSVLRLANAPIVETLRPCKDESLNYYTTENLYIEGENLKVIKLLQETYLNKIKMIYIDPPYNTGKDSFVYDDNYSIDSAVFSGLSGQYDEDGNMLFEMKANSETNGRFHTDWLNMMYSRLKLARGLLTDDGVICISIDEKEMVNLTKICDEIFGVANHLETFHIQVRYANKSLNEDNDFQPIMEYILIYSKNKEKFEPRKPSEPYDLSKFCYSFEELTQGETLQIANKTVTIFKQGEWKITKHNEGKIGLLKETWASGSIVKQSGTAAEFLAKYLIDRKPKDGLGVLYKIHNMGEDGLGYRYVTGPVKQDAIRGKFYSGVPLDRLEEIKNGTSVKYRPIVNYYDYSGDFGNIRHEGGIPFNSGKKPIKMLQHLLYICGVSDNDIVMDFFSGSGSFAHAVLEYNDINGIKANYITVQIPASIDEKDDLAKLGINNIVEVGKQRLNNIAKQYIGKDNRSDVGYRVLKLDTSNMKDVYYNPSETQQSLFDTYADNIKEDRTPEDLLFQVMLDLGVLLSSKIEETTIAGKQVFNVADGFLIACFDKDVTEETVKAVAEKKPYYAVFRDSSMANDSVATNFDQIFASISPDTVRKVL